MARKQKVRPLALLGNLIRRTMRFIRDSVLRLFKRDSIANLLMLAFILLCAFGAGMIYLPAGLITAGVACGLYGFLLGSE